MTRPLDLRAGDMVDLEGDPYADPDHDIQSFQFLYMEVTVVEQETPECVRVNFADWDSCGFPVDHELTRREGL